MNRKSRLLCAGVGELNRRVAGLWQQAGGEVIGFRRSAVDTGLGFEQHIVNLAQSPWPDRQPAVVIVALSAGERTLEAYQRTYLQSLHRLAESLSDWAQLPERIVLVSSSRVYGEDDGSRIDDDTVAASDDPYAQVLLQMEQVAQTLPVPVVIARLTGIYGPGRDWMKRMALQADPESPPPNAWTNRIHIDDAARALVYLARLESAEPSYLVSDLKPQSRYQMYNYFLQREDLPLLAETKAPTAGKYVMPERLKASGFQWRYPDAFSGGY